MIGADPRWCTARASSGVEEASTGMIRPAMREVVTMALLRGFVLGPDRTDRS